MSKRAFILLGSNIDPRNNIRKAIDYLNDAFEVRGISKIYESKPIKNSNAENYLNAVVEVNTNLEPKDIKYDKLRKIEDKMGRTRSQDKYKPRVIDLDLILYGDKIYDDGDIVLPDPEILRYAHVARPLADIIPEKKHPLSHKTYDTIAKNIEASSELVTVNL